MYEMTKSASAGTSRSQVTALVMAVLQPQPATGHQVLSCVAHDTADLIQAVFSPKQGRTGFEAHVSLRQVRLGRRYGESIEVLAGLNDCESVATDPVSAGIWLKEQAN